MSVLLYISTLQFRAKYFTPRTVETYNYHCTLLDSPLFKEHSVTYGINHCSTLNDIDNFHVVKQMPQDIMHVLLEGVVPYEVKLMLVYFIAERKLFTCELLNDRIDCFPYSNHESKDKPSPIKARGFLFKTGSLSQSCKPNCKSNFYLFHVSFLCIQLLRCGFL